MNIFPNDVKYKTRLLGLVIVYKDRTNHGRSACEIHPPVGEAQSRHLVVRADNIRCRSLAHLYLLLVNVERHHFLTRQKYFSFYGR
jgi:hypothetical protein